MQQSLYTLEIIAPGKGKLSDEVVLTETSYCNTLWSISSSRVCGAMLW